MLPRGFIHFFRPAGIVSLLAPLSLAFLPDARASRLSVAKESTPLQSASPKSASDVCAAAIQSEKCKLKTDPAVATALNGLKLQCQTNFKASCQSLSNAMKPEERAEKLNKCDTGDVCSALTQEQMAQGCINAFKKYGKEALESFKKNYVDNARCNSSLEAKTKMIDEYNRTVPPFMQRPLASLPDVQKMNCSEISRVLVGYSENQARVLESQFQQFEMAHPRNKAEVLKKLKQARDEKRWTVGTASALYTEAGYDRRLAEYREWVEMEGTAQAEALRNTLEAIGKINMAQVQAVWDRFNLNPYCYSAEHRGALMCYGAILAGEQGASMMLSGGLMAALPLKVINAARRFLRFAGVPDDFLGDLLKAEKVASPSRPGTAAQNLNATGSTASVRPTPAAPSGANSLNPRQPSASTTDSLASSRANNPSPPSGPLGRSGSPSGADATRAASQRTAPVANSSERGGPGAGSQPSRPQPQNSPARDSRSSSALTSQERADLEGRLNKGFATREAQFHEDLQSVVRGTATKVVTDRMDTVIQDMNNARSFLLSKGLERSDEMVKRVEGKMSDMLQSRFMNGKKIEEAGQTELGNLRQALEKRKADSLISRKETPVENDLLAKVDRRLQDLENQFQREQRAAMQSAQRRDSAAVPSAARDSTTDESTVILPRNSPPAAAEAPVPSTRPQTPSAARIPTDQELAAQRAQRVAERENEMRAQQRAEWQKARQEEKEKKQKQKQLVKAGEKWKKDQKALARREEIRTRRELAKQDPAARPLTRQQKSEISRLAKNLASKDPMKLTEKEVEAILSWKNEIRRKRDFDSQRVQGNNGSSNSSHFQGMLPEDSELAQQFESAFANAQKRVSQHYRSANRLVDDQRRRFARDFPEHPGDYTHTRLRAAQPGYPLPDHELIAYRPLIDNAKTMDDFTKALGEKVPGLGKADIAAVNHISTMEPINVSLRSYEQVPRARAFVEKIEKAQKEGRLEGLGENDRNLLDRVVETARFYQTSTVPPHLQRLVHP